MSTTETNHRFGIINPDDPMVMIDRDHCVPLSRMTQGYVRQRLQWAAKTETPFALIDELAYWANWLGNDLLERQDNRAPRVDGLVNLLADPDQPLDHEATCAVCWLAREIGFASDEYGDDWPNDLMAGFQDALGAHMYLAGHDQYDHAPEHHEGMSAESLSAATAAALYIADYRRGGAA